MKIVIVILALIVYCYAFSQPVILNTKKTGKIGDRTGDYCGWEDVKLWPGDSTTQPGKCRLLQCRNDFNIYITPCPIDPTRKYQWINRDNSKPYPSCCGERVPA